jgi:hypothetical protein
MNVPEIVLKQQLYVMALTETVPFLGPAGLCQHPTTVALALRMSLRKSNEDDRRRALIPL